MRDQEIVGLWEAYASMYTQTEQTVEEEVLNEDLQQKVGQALDAAAKNPVIKAIGAAITPVGPGRGTVTKADQQKRIQQNVAKEEVEQVDENIGGVLNNPIVANKEPKKGGPSTLGQLVGDKLAGNKSFTKGKPPTAVVHGMKKEEVEVVDFDLFDVILEYLVAEGYADTNKAALAIMANMSEEWKQEIVDACELQEKLKPGTKRVSFSTGRDESHNQAMTETNPRTGRQRGTSPELKAIGAHARARTAQRNAEKSGDTQAAQRHKNRRDKIATVVYNKTNRIIDRADND